MTGPQYLQIVVMMKAFADCEEGGCPMCEGRHIYSNVAQVMLDAHRNGHRTSEGGMYERLDTAALHHEQLVDERLERAGLERTPGGGFKYKGDSTGRGGHHGIH